MSGNGGSWHVPEKLERRYTEPTVVEMDFSLCLRYLRQILETTSEPVLGEDLVHQAIPLVLEGSD